MNIYCGIDFGTTNTVVSICGKKGDLIDSFSTPTTLFIPQKQMAISGVIIGEKAWDEYNKDRDGRYIHSIKRSLSDKHFTHTRINNLDVTVEDLVFYFLQELNKEIFQRWALTPENIVLGRPVKFSTDPEEDALANERLLAGFKRGGYKNILQLQEPIAASFCFDDSLEKDDSQFLIVDLGGGTSDFSLISRDTDKDGVGKYRIEYIDGVDIGGDHFDEELMFGKVSPLLGINSTYESFGKRIGMPVHVYRDVCKWNNLFLYNKLQLADDFRDFLYDSDDREGVERLKTIIEERLSHSFLESVRETKHELSAKDNGRINFDHEEVKVDVSVSQGEFSTFLKSQIDSVFTLMEEVMDHKGDRSKIDRVILTGGSSRNTIIYKRVLDHVEEDRVLRDEHFFDSVSKGLAFYAHYKELKIV
jgi:hypothetical chaperone protein